MSFSITGTAKFPPPCSVWPEIVIVYIEDGYGSTQNDLLSIDRVMKHLIDDDSIIDRDLGFATVHVPFWLVRWDFVVVYGVGMHHSDRYGILYKDLHSIFQLIQVRNELISRVPASSSAPQGVIWGDFEHVNDVFLHHCVQKDEYYLDLQRILQLILFCLKSIFGDYRLMTVLPCLIWLELDVVGGKLIHFYARNGDWRGCLRDCLFISVLIGMNHGVFDSVYGGSVIHCNWNDEYSIDLNMNLIFRMILSVVNRLDYVKSLQFLTASVVFESDEDTSNNLHKNQIEYGRFEDQVTVSRNRLLDWLVVKSEFDLITSVVGYKLHKSLRFRGGNVDSTATVENQRVNEVGQYQMNQSGTFNVDDGKLNCNFNLVNSAEDNLIATVYGGNKGVKRIDVFNSCSAGQAVKLGSFAAVSEIDRRNVCNCVEGKFENAYKSAEGSSIELVGSDFNMMSDFSKLGKKSQQPLRLRGGGGNDSEGKYNKEAASKQQIEAYNDLVDRTKFGRSDLHTKGAGMLNFEEQGGPVITPRLVREEDVVFSTPVARVSDTPPVVNTTDGCLSPAEIRAKLRTAVRS